ncbi:hypothetical protein QL285_094457 [Trifolium repens]|nr:hypothetical protein QL285_094457 [Trifolium repens]
MRLVGNNDGLHWSWNWSEGLNEAEEQHLINLKVLFEGFSFQPTCSDRWRWIPNTNGIFSIKSCYSWLVDSRQEGSLDDNLLNAIKKLWRTDVPSKVHAFGWRLLLNRLPTRASLNRRCIFPNAHYLPCVFCFQNVEDNAHLSFFRRFSKVVWDEVYKWLGQQSLLDNEGWNHFVSFGDLSNSKVDGRVRHLIWLATTWIIWKHRNNVIFNGALPDTKLIIDEVKTFAWLWFSNRFGIKTCITFSCWCIDPMACFQST